MKKRNLVLAGVLGLQIMFALYFFLLGNSGSGDFESTSLLRLDKTQIEKIMIRNNDIDIILVKTEGKWFLSGKEGLPVDAAKLNGFLDKISGLKTSWPVAATASSHERFEVSDDKYRRKITFFSGTEVLAELYMGTSPGFRKSHLRVNGEDEVYSLGLNTFDAPVMEKEWFDKLLLTVTTVNQINGKDYDLVKKDKSWTFAGQNQDRKVGQVNQESATTLEKALGAFRVLDIAKELPGEAGDNKTLLKVNNGTAYVFELMQSEDKYFVRRSDNERVFSLSKFEYERLAKPDLASLTLIEEDGDSESEAVLTDEKEME